MSGRNDNQIKNRILWLNKKRKLSETEETTADESKSHQYVEDDGSSDNPEIFQNLILKEFDVEAFLNLEF